ncbi:RNA 2',3'-cyclic phosphodiesterase [Candidatus Bathyarchaeota archaeon]|nr:MAG: RNA 2',3'-cyclic phosphodiesterase [Candidatus Bathyarchaeota archaeon]
MSERLRTFIAFDIDDSAIIERLTYAQTELAKTGADLKLVEPRNIHITIRFLGNISPGMVEKIHDAMRNVDFKPFTIEIRGLGAFPSLRFPRVVWAGIKGGEEELKNIFDQLEPQLRKLGFQPDPKGFSPHITIARVRTGRNKSELIKKLREFVDLNIGTFTVKCLRLKKSTLTPKGPIYTTLREVCH